MISLLHAMPAAVRPRGETATFVWQGPEPPRLAYLYEPPVSQPRPLVVVYDGFGYHHRAKLYPFETI